MSDDFTVTHITEVGSDGARIEFFRLMFTKNDVEIEELTAEELCRLSDFLSAYTKDMRKGVRDGK